MKKVSYYQQHAEECRQLARQMMIPEQKQQLEEMAKAWDMHAQARVRQLTSQEGENRLKSSRSHH